MVADRFCRNLFELGWDVEVITSDCYARDVDRSWVEDFEAPYEMTVLRSQGPQGFGYCSGLSKVLEGKLRNADVVHIHNLWSFFNIIGSKCCRKMNVPFVVSTHGMLDPNSLSRKAWKKKFYGLMFEWPRLRHAAGMIYTHPEEQRLAENQCAGLANGHVVPLAADEPPDEPREDLVESFLSRYPTLRGRRLVMFLGRLHSKKGLDLLIPAFKKLRASHEDVSLVLVGPCEPKYLESLRKMAIAEGIDADCHFLGAVAGREKWAALCAASLFALPSYQENFAIALVEAMSVGTPVLISKRINIWNEIQAADAGVVTDLTIQDVAGNMETMLRDCNVLRIKGENARSFALGGYSWRSSAQSLIGAYNSLLGCD